MGSMASKEADNSQREKLMRHRRLWHNLMLVVAALGLLWTACDGGGKETPMPAPIPTRPAVEGEQDTIRFAVYDWQQPVYKDLIETFKEINPGLHVELVSIEDTLGFGSKQGPDWAIRLLSAADVAEMWMISPEISRLGLVRDLAPLIEADPTFGRTTFTWPLLQDSSDHSSIFPRKRGCVERPIGCSRPTAGCWRVTLALKRPWMPRRGRPTITAPASWLARLSPARRAGKCA
jgi:hypothetical protein